MKAAVLAFVSLTALACPVQAQGPVELYTARVFVTGQHEDNRPAAFAQALEEVLVKVSGDGRLTDDPRVDSYAKDADRYVASFSYRDRMAGIPVHDEQGTRQRPFELTVVFAPEKIDRLLADLGQTAWRDRPSVLVVVDVTPGGGAPYRLTGDGPHGRDLREALAAEARRIGLTAVLPEGATDSPAPGEVQLAGTLVWSDAALGWTAEWRFDDNGDVHDWRVDGVSFDAAFRSGLRGVAGILSRTGPPR